MESPVEKTKPEGSKTSKHGGAPFAFPPPRRRSHLKSETFSTLLRILSLCHDESQSSPAFPIVTEAPKPGIQDGELGQATQQEGFHESVDPGCLEPGNLLVESTEVTGIQNGTSSPEQIQINELDHRMGLDGKEGIACGDVLKTCNVSMEKDLIANDDSVSINVHCDNIVSERNVVEESGKVAGITQDNKFNFSVESTEVIGIQNPEQIVTDELGCRTGLEGDEDLVCGNIPKPLNILLENDRDANDVVASIDNCCDDLGSEQIGMEESGQVPGVIGESEIKILKAISSSLEHDLITEESISFGNSQDITSLAQSVLEELEHEISPKEGDLKKSISSYAITDSSVSLIADREIENSRTSLAQSVVVEQEHEIRQEEVDLKKLISLNAITDSSVSLIAGEIEDGDSSLAQNIVEEIEHEIHQKEVDLKTSISSNAIMDSYVSLATDREIKNGTTSLAQSVVEELDHEIRKKEVDLKNAFYSNAIMDSSISLIADREIEDGETSLAENVMEELELEICQKEMNLKNLISSNAIMDPSVSLIADREIEDGEISDDLGVSNESIDLHFEDVIERKGGKEQSSGDFMKKRKFSNTCKEHKGEDEKDIAHLFHLVGKLDSQEDPKGRKRKRIERSDSFVCVGTAISKQVCGDDSILEVGNKKKKGNVPKGEVNLPVAPPNGVGFAEELSEKILTVNRGTNFSEKDAKVCNKKKRGPITEESKIKKKLKKKRKRAEKNKLLGVKRLKLQPVTNPKPVKYCKHYLKGRCQQGDSCKFSHDIVPLTKSQPCKHFARHSCLKGDDCPFDHELSKYPCNNYMSKGSCIRGDKCLFSHKMTPNEGSIPSSNVGKPESGPSALPDNSNSRKQVNIDKTSHYTVSDLSKKTTPFSVGTFLHRNPKQNVVGKGLEPLAPAPKGISFLSIGKASLNDPIKRQQGDLPFKRIDGVELGIQKNQCASDNHQNLSEMPWRKPTALAPKGISFVSVGKAPLSDSIKQQQDALPSKSSGVEICNLKNHSVLDKLQNSNEVALKVLASPHSICHSSTPLADGHNKTTPSSAQKALSSTLAFAAKFESEMMMGRSICPTAFSANADKTLRNSSDVSGGRFKSESMKASKILEEFLFGVGAKSKR